MRACRLLAVLLATVAAAAAQQTPPFTEAERAVFDFAIAAASIPNGVTDEIAENLREHWDDGEIVEILGVVALFGYLNRWNDSMGTQLEEPAADDGNKFLSGTLK